jgi:hypothetical protein
MKVLKPIVALFVFSLFCTFANGQSHHLQGTVVNDEDGSGMPGASVLARQLADSTVWFGVVTNADGVFDLPISATGSYRLEITYIGYNKYSTVQTVVALSGNTNVGTIRLSPSNMMLDAVTVEDVASRVTMKGDTSIYNADAFKVNRDADAKGLLDKMPGVTSEGGNVSVQGERVQRVLVDGKEFFGNDPRVALNTIPAEIIDKIQVFDQLSEQSQASGFNDGNTIKTINIITKAGKSEGEFGKVFAGVGTDHRYLAGGNVNIFKGDRRISILGLSNNVNQSNFATEDIAGAVGSTVDQINNPRRGPRQQGAGTGSADDFLVAPQNGINTTTAFGINFTDQFGEKLKLNASYLFNTTDNINDYFLRRSFSAGQTQGQLYQEQSTERSTNVNHKFNLRAEYDINEKSSVLFRPSFGYQDFDGYNNQVFSTNLSDSTLNAGTNATYNQSQALNFNNELLYRLRMAKKGQSFSVSWQTSYSNSDGQNGLESEQLMPEGEFLEIDNWRADRIQSSQRQRLNLSYTHPLGERTSLEMGYRPEWEKGVSTWTTRTIDLADDYTIVDPSLSNDFESVFTTHEARFRLRYRGEKKAFVVAGLNYEYTENDNAQAFPSVFENQRIYRNFVPFALYRKTYENKGSLFMLYRASPNLPSARQLNTIIDNTNPLQVSIGNANLDQSFGHRFVSRYSLTNVEKGTNFFVFISAEAEDGRISNSTFLVQSDTTFANGFTLPAGGQITQPINLDGYLNARSFANYGFPVGFLKSNLNLNATVTYNKSPGQVDGQLNFAENTGMNTGFLLGSNISERVDFKVGASAGLNWVYNSLPSQENYDFQTYTVTAGGVFTPFSRWVLSTDFGYNIYRGLGDLDQEFTLWNAGLGYRFLKDESLELRLTAFDILSQNNSISRNVTETFVEDRETEVLQRYLMVSLSYRLRNFKGTEAAPIPAGE